MISNITSLWLPSGLNLRFPVAAILWAKRLNQRGGTLKLQTLNGYLFLNISLGLVFGGAFVGSLLSTSALASEPGPTVEFWEGIYVACNDAGKGFADCYKPEMERRFAASNVGDFCSQPFDTFLGRQEKFFREFRFDNAWVARWRSYPAANSVQLLQFASDFYGECGTELESVSRALNVQRDARQQEEMVRAINRNAEALERLGSQPQGQGSQRMVICGKHDFACQQGF